MMILFFGGADAKKNSLTPDRELKTSQRIPLKSTLS